MTRVRRLFADFHVLHRRAFRRVRRRGQCRTVRFLMRGTSIAGVEIRKGNARRRSTTTTGRENRGNIEAEFDRAAQAIFSGPRELKDRPQSVLKRTTVRTYLRFVHFHWFFIVSEECLCFLFGEITEDETLINDTVRFSSEARGRRKLTAMLNNAKRRRTKANEKKSVSQCWTAIDCLRLSNYIITRMSNNACRCGCCSSTAWGKSSRNEDCRVRWDEKALNHQHCWSREKKKKKKKKHFSMLILFPSFLSHCLFVSTIVAADPGHSVFSVHQWQPVNRMSVFSPLSRIRNEFERESTIFLFGRINEKSRGTFSWKTFLFISPPAKRHLSRAECAWNMHVYNLFISFVDHGNLEFGCFAEHRGDHAIRVATFQFVQFLQKLRHDHRRRKLMILFKVVHRRLALLVDSTEMFQRRSEIHLLGEIMRLVSEKVDQSMNDQKILFIQAILVFLLTMTNAFCHT